MKPSTRGFSARQAVLMTIVLGSFLAPSGINLWAKPGKKSSTSEKTTESKKSKKSKGASSAAKKPAKKLSIDELYVRDTLKDYLHPTSITFLDGGRVKMSFDFEKKNPDHERIFTVPIDIKVSSRFRWTVRREQRYYSSTFRGGGLRVADGGMALLRCWFHDDVEAEMYFAIGTNFAANKTAAVVFYNKSGAGIGNNFGGQCVKYRKGKPGKRRGTPLPMTLYNARNIKLVVKDETFHAYSDGREKASMSYKKRTFRSGRIGVAWGGNVAGMIGRLEVTGKIDVKKTADEIRRARKKRR